MKPVVFCGLFPTDNNQFETLRDSLGKLQLNDAALSYEPEVQPRESIGKLFRVLLLFQMGLNGADCAAQSCCSVLRAWNAACRSSRHAMSGPVLFSL